MARYRATIKGQRGQASRLGGPASGIAASVNGWNLGIGVTGMPANRSTHNGDDAQCSHDRFEVRITGGSNASWNIPIATIEEDANGNGKTITLYGRDGKVLDTFPVRV